MKTAMQPPMKILHALALAAGLLPMAAVQANHFYDKCTRSDGQPIGSSITIQTAATIDPSIKEGEAYGPWLSHEVTFTCTRTPELHAGSTFQPNQDYFEVKTTWAATDAVDRGVFAADPNYHVYSSYGIGFIARITEHIDGQPPQTTPFNKSIGSYTTTIFTGTYARQAGDVSKFHRKLEIRLVRLKEKPTTPHIFYPVSTNFYTKTRHEHKNAHTWLHNSAYAYYLKTAINQIVGTCKTVNGSTIAPQTVQLGRVHTNDIPDIGDAGPMTAFDLHFLECPKGLKSINYTFEPLPAGTSPVNGILPQRLAAAATGVGVQVLDGSGQPIVFNTPITLAAYDKHHPDPDYVVPLKARIIRTDSTANAGKLEAAMNVVVTYK